MFGDNKPSGIEAMVAKMIGISPAQMAEAFTNLQATILAVGDALARIEKTQAAILERLDNDDCDRTGGGTLLLDNRSASDTSGSVSG